MYRQGDKEKIAAKLAAESRENRGLCREGAPNLLGQGKISSQTLLAANLTRAKLGEIMG